MRMIFLTLFLTSILSFSAMGIGEKETDWASYGIEEVDEYLQERDRSERAQNMLYLKLAKKLLINGQVTRAKFYLKKIYFKNPELDLLKKRYLGIIHFIQEDFIQSSKMLSDPRFADVLYYKEVCLMRFINALALGDLPTMTREYRTCRPIGARYSKNDQFWLDILYRLRVKDPEIFKGGIFNNKKFILADNETVKLWLKLGLYTNQESVIINRLASLSPSAYRSKKVRELIGHIYYRMGENKEAFSFIEDIDSPISESIKGNIKLANREYELAFGHFKLALKHKENSLNAIERGLPLAWILEQWKDGLEFLAQLPPGESEERKKMTLSAAFQIRLKNYKKANRIVDLLNEKFQFQFPKELDVMASYVALMNENKPSILEYGLKACRNFDGLNCWQLIQMGLWPNLSQTIKRDDLIYDDKDLTIESLKAYPQQRLRESVLLVDQRDIEELDSANVKIPISD